MAYTTINKSTDYFNTKLYTGNGSTNAITGVGHQPDFTWLKRRDGSGNHNLYDAVRGVTKYLESSATSPEQTQSAGLTTFGTDGFTLGSNANMNGNSQTFVSWNWKAGGGQGSSNTDGSINTTYTSVNTTAGFSISKYTGTGANATVGHGLGVAPKMIIIKELNNATNWIVYHASTGNDKGLQLNTTAATDTDSTFWNSTTPTSSVFSLGSNGNVNGSSDNYIAYCFAEKTGYSKMGSFVGNGNADAPFIYCGFKPKWFLWKSSTDTTNANWNLVNSTAQVYNGADAGYVMANDSTAETGFSGNQIDFVSNGMKLRQSSNYHNNNGQTYIYLAFGQSSVGTNNIPCTAR